MCASGARISRGAHRALRGHVWRSPASWTAISVSTTPPRTPEAPRARLAALSASISRTTAAGSSSPTPTECERMRLSCSASSASASMRVWASLPKPVLTPYTGAAPCGALRDSRARLERRSHRRIEHQAHAAGVDRREGRKGRSCPGRWVARRSPDRLVISGLRIVRHRVECAVARHVRRDELRQQHIGEQRSIRGVGMQCRQVPSQCLHRGRIHAGCGYRRGSASKVWSRRTASRPSAPVRDVDAGPARSSRARRRRLRPHAGHRASLPAR